MEGKRVEIRSQNLFGSRGTVIRTLPNEHVSVRFDAEPGEAKGIVRIIPIDQVSVIGEQDSVHQDDSQADLQMLCEMFPETPLDVMEQIYLAMNKDSQAVINELLDSAHSPVKVQSPRIDFEEEEFAMNNENDQSLDEQREEPNGPDFSDLLNPIAIVEKPVENPVAVSTQGLQVGGVSKPLAALTKEEVRRMRLEALTGKSEVSKPNNDTNNNNNRINANNNNTSFNSSTNNKTVPNFNKFNNGHNNSPLKNKKLGEKKNLDNSKKETKFFDLTSSSPVNNNSNNNKLSSNNAYDLDDSDNWEIVTDQPQGRSMTADDSKKETVNTMEEDEKLAQTLQYEMDRDYALAVRERQNNKERQERPIANQNNENNRRTSPQRYKFNDYPSDGERDITINNNSSGSSNSNNNTSSSSSFNKFPNIFGSNNNNSSGTNFSNINRPPTRNEYSSSNRNANRNDYYDQTKFDEQIAMELQKEEEEQRQKAREERENRDRERSRREEQLSIDARMARLMEAGPGVNRTLFFDRDSDGSTDSSDDIFEHPLLAGDPMLAQLHQMLTRRNRGNPLFFQIPQGNHGHLPHRERDFASGNAYEQLLELDKNNVKVVMSQDEVENMPSFTYNSKMNLDNTSCSICLLDYEEGDQIRTISCFHQFHQECIDRWLTTEKKICPVCQSNV